MTRDRRYSPNGARPPRQLRRVPGTADRSSRDRSASGWLVGLPSRGPPHGAPEPWTRAREVVGSQVATSVARDTHTYRYVSSCVLFRAAVSLGRRQIAPANGGTIDETELCT